MSCGPLVRSTFYLLLAVTLAQFVLALRAAAQEASIPSAKKSVVTAADTSSATEEATTPQPEVIQYRRLFVPEERLADVVPRDDTYLSISRAEFERLMGMVRASERGATMQPARMVRATYRARLEGSELVAGEAELEIEHQGPAACVLPLDPCTLAVSNPIWHDVAQPTPAVLGISSGTGPLGAIVERSGNLRFSWSLRGERNTPDSLSFDLGLPQATTKHVDLDLPADQVLLSSRGVVSKQGAAVNGRQSWRLELGGHDRVTIRIVAVTSTAQRQRLTLLRQADSYDFSPHGVQLTSELTLDVHHEPLPSISLTLESKLRLVMARMAGADVPWTATTDAESGLTTVVLQLASPIEGVGRVLQLKAVAPLETDAPWQLPRLRPEGMFWAEGSTRLLVPSPLSLLQLTPLECRQTMVEELSPPLVGEVFELQQFSPEAGVEVLVARKAGRLQLQQGTAIDVGVSELTGRTVAEFRIDEAEQFSLMADIAGDWILDSVETVPSGALQDWNTEPLAKNLRRLRVELRKALTPSGPLQVIVTGRWRRPISDTTLSVAECRMVDFNPHEAGSRLALVRPARSLQMSLLGDEAFARLDSAKLTPPIAALFDAVGSPGILFDLDQASPELKFSFQSERPRFSAEVSLEASVTEAALTESYVLHCVPESARIERLLIHFSEPRDADPHWTIDGEADPQLTARRLHPDEAEIPDQIVGGETWEVVLRRPRISPFDLQAVRSRAFASETPISLAALPEAASQTGQLSLVSEGASRVVLREHRLKAVPGGQAAATRAPENRGTFEYESGRDVLSPASPAMIVAPATKDARLPAAWVWSQQLDTRVGSDHGTSHIATYRIENLGRAALKIGVPAAAAVEAVWLDETPVPQSVVSGFGQSFQVELPAGRRFPVITVYFVTQDKLPTLANELAPPLPVIDIPVLSANWTIWLPPGFEVASGAQSRRPTLSWSQRLFGPLGRSTTRIAQRDSAASELEPWQFEVSSTRAKEWGEEFLQQLGTQVQNDSGTSARSWGETLRFTAAALASPMSETDPAGQTAPESGFPALWIDDAALARAGATAATLVSNSDASDPLHRGLAALQSAGMTLLVQPDAIIVTSVELAALHANQLQPLVGSTVYQLRAGSWQAMLEEAREAAILLSAADWAARPLPPVRPWTLPGGPADDLVGWSAVRIPLSQSDPRPVMVVSQRVVQATAWAMFLLACSLIWWWLPGRTSWYVALLAMLGAAALLVPAAYSPLASGILLGTLAGGCALLLRGRLSESPAVEKRSLWRSLAPAGITTPLLITMASFFIEREQQAQAQAPAQKQAGQLFSVFVPTDAQGNPSDYYVISDQFRTLLQRRARATTYVPPPWLLTSADYQARLNQPGTPPRLNIAELKATWTLRTFQRDVKVAIPLRQGEVTVVPGSARLNARLTQPTWSPSGESLLFAAPEPGEYEISLIMGSPGPETVNAQGGADLLIPTLATSQLTLQLPTRSPDVSLPTAKGAVKPEANESGTLMRAALGAAERLVIAWPSGEGPGAVNARTEVEELHWLRVEPGAVEMFVRLKVKVLEGRIGQLRLATDPRLKLLPLGEDSPVAQVRAEAGPVQTLIMDLRRPVSDQVTIDARLLLTGASGIGNLRLPYVQLISSQVKQRWLGISIDEALAPGDAGGESIPTVAVGDFTAAWGSMETAPQLAYRLPPRDILWSLPIRPRQAKTTYQEQLKVGIGLEQTHLDFVAELNTTTGFNFQHQLQVPGGLNVEEVRLESITGENCLAHWSQTTSGHLGLFLNRPMSGPHRLHVRGHLPSKTNEPWRIPQIKLTTAILSAGVLQVYRRPEAAVALNPGPHLKLQNDAAGTAELPGLGRLLASYDFQAGPADATVLVSPNEPQIASTSTLVTRLLREQTGWQVEVDFRLRVQAGLVDVVRLDVPESWSGPFTVELSSNSATEHPAPRVTETAGVKAGTTPTLLPPAFVQVLPALREGRKQLLITPPQAVNDFLRLQIRGPLSITSGDRVRVPEILPWDRESFDRFILLPSNAGAQRLSWEVRGLKVSAPPANLSDQVNGAPHFEAYQVIAERFDAISKNTGRTANRARVRLADVTLASAADGHVAGVASFTLEPADLTECLLQLPEEFHPVQVRVAGLPALAEPAGDGRWRVPLGPRQLTQQIDVLYSGRVSLAPVVREMTLSAPVLWNSKQPLPVESSLWTSYGAADWGTGSPEAGATVSRAQQDLHRMQQIASLLETLDSQISIEHTTQQLDLWYQAWAERLLKLNDDLQRTSPPTGTTSSAATDQAESKLALQAAALVKGQSEIARRLGVAETLVRLQSQRLPATEGEELWQWSLEDRRAPLRVRLNGPASELVVRYPSASASDLPWRLAGAVLLFAGGLALVELARRQWLQPLVLRWWPLLGLACGAAWAIWLTPSLLGWAIMFATLVLAPWPVLRNEATT